MQIIDQLRLGATSLTDVLASANTKVSAAFKFFTGKITQIRSASCEPVLIRMKPRSGKSEINLGDQVTGVCSKRDRQEACGGRGDFKRAERHDRRMEARMLDSGGMPDYAMLERWDDGDSLILDGSFASSALAGNKSELKGILRYVNTSPKRELDSAGAATDALTAKRVRFAETVKY